MSNQNLFDPGPINELRELDNGGNELVSNLVDMFEKSASEMVEQLRKAMDKNDLKEAARLAHILKSSSGNLGAVAFSTLCMQMEELVVQKHPQAVTQVRMRMNQLIEILGPTLEILRQQSGARQLN